MVDKVEEIIEKINNEDFYLSYDGMEEKHGENRGFEDFCWVKKINFDINNRFVIL